MAYLAVLRPEHGTRAGAVRGRRRCARARDRRHCCGLGLAALIASSPAAYQALRWAGIAYLLWLAWETWRDGVAGRRRALTGGDAGYFSRGLLTNLLNPKAAIFYVAVMPMHLDPARPLVGQSILLSLVYVAIATAIHLTIVMLAGSVSPFLAKAESSRGVHRVFALLLVGVAVWFAIGTAK